jgi:hypothetical protein
MRYFTVQALNTLNQSLLEIDIPLSQIRPLLNGIEENLRSQGVFDHQDRLLKRLVPRFEPRGDQVAAQLLERVPADVGEFDYGLYFEEDPGDPPRSIQSLSVWFCSPMTGRTCSVDLPVNWLFRSAQAHLFQQLVRRQQVNEGDRLHYAVFLQGQAQLRAQQTRGRTALLLLLPTKPPPPEVETLDRQALDKPSVEVTVTNRESLVTPAKRSWRDYEARLIGVRQRGDLRILISYHLIDQLEVVARDSLRQDAEVGGFLIGDVYQDEEDEKLFVDISDIVAADQATGSFLELRFNQEAWQQAFEEINRRFPDKRRVGWYHTHLIGIPRLQPVALPEARGERTYKLTHTPFFSSADVFLHRNFFPEPWHVALVVDLKNRTIMFYQWKRGEIASCKGYYVYD